MAAVCNVLIAYASEHRSTRGVAERLAARLGERGVRVEVRPITDVDGVGGYDAVVLGSGVYNQRCIPSGTEFVRDNAAFARRPASVAVQRRVVRRHPSRDRHADEERAQGDRRVPGRDPPARVQGVRRQDRTTPMAVGLAFVLLRVRWSLGRQPRLASVRRVGRKNRPGAAASNAVTRVPAGVPFSAGNRRRLTGRVIARQATRRRGDGKVGSGRSGIDPPGPRVNA
jgi:hypothetical protein